MPTADPFNALTKGNGLAFCASKVDVSGFDKWQTLGGYRDSAASGGTAVTAAQIQTSLDNAMLLYWNMNGNVVSAAASNIGGGNNLSTSAGSSGTSVVTINAGVPKTRVCGTTSAGAYKLVYTDEQNDNSGSLNVDADVFVDLEIIRMYNGATTSESNFIGYGASDIIVNSLASGGGGVIVTAGVVISSYMNGTTSSTLKNEYFDMSYGSGLSVPIVCKVQVNGTFSGTPTLTFSPPQARAVNTVGTPEIIVDSKFSSFEVYTYS